MPRTKKPPTPPETYEAQINPNTLAIALESALKSATAPLYEEIRQLDPWPRYVHFSIAAAHNPHSIVEKLHYSCIGHLR